MFQRRRNITILKHHRHTSVYLDGRYLVVDMRLSERSKRGRELARETASEILNRVGANETAFRVIQNATIDSIPTLDDRVDDGEPLNSMEHPPGGIERAGSLASGGPVGVADTEPLDEMPDELGERAPEDDIDPPDEQGDRVPPDFGRGPI